MRRKIMIMATAILLFFSLVPSNTSFATSIDYQKSEEEYMLSNDSLETPNISFEVNTSDGKPALGSKVIITSLTSEVKEELITEVGKSGVVEFLPQVDADLINSAPGNVFDVTYEVTFQSLDGETSQSYFNVPFVKEAAGLSEEDVKSLNDLRKQKIEINFSGQRFIDILQENKDERLKNDLNISDSVTSSQTINKTMPSTGCVPHVSGVSYSCLLQTTYYTVPVKVASANVAKDETVEFKLDSGAQAKMSWGTKATATAGWSIGGTLSKSVDVSTGVDFTVPGECKIFWGVSSCNLQRDFYVNYQFMYTVTDYYTQDKVYVDTEYKVVPTTIAGPAPLTGKEWVYNSNNAKPSAEVAKSTNPYGTWFAIYSGASRSRSYTQEFTYGGGIDIPALGFSGSVTTLYKTKHQMTWKTSSSKTFYHYDINNQGQNYYVTH